MGTVTVVRARDDEIDGDAPQPGTRAGWALLSVLLGWTWGAVLPALLGVFSLWTAGPAALVVGALVWRARPPGAATARAAGAVRTAGRWATAAVGVAVVTTAWHVALPSEQLTSGRDGGTYANTAAWLAHDGDLVIEAGTGPFADAPDLGLRVAGFQTVRGPDDLYPQFLHAFPAMLATGYEVAGLDGLLVVNPVLGGLALLAVFGAASRVVRPGWAFVAQLAVALNLVTVAFTRAPFSELLAVCMVLGGVWALDVVRDAPRRASAVVAGATLGGVALARLDGLVLAVVLGGMVAVAVLDRRHTGSSGAGDPAWLWPLVGAGAAVPVVVALADTAVYSPFYLTMHADYLLPIVAALVGVALLGLAASTRAAGRAWRWLRAQGPRSAVPVGVGFAVVAALAWFVRPEVVVDTWDRSMPIAPLQVAAGQEVDRSRTYAEQTMRWLSWYVGPAGLALAVAGWAGLIAAVLRGRARRVVPLLMLVSALTTLYIARPSITPDQIWAMRRFLTVGIPGLAIFAAWAAQVGVDTTRRRARLAAPVVGAVLVAALVGGPAVTTAPFAALHERAGVADVFDDACARLGDDAAVLVADAGFLEWGTTQSWRSYCGLPAARLQGPITDERLAELAAAWATRGRTLWLLAPDDDLLDRPVLASPVDLGEATYRAMVQRIDGPPRTTYEGRLRVVGAPVRPATGGGA